MGGRATSWESWDRIRLGFRRGGRFTASGSPILVHCSLVLRRGLPHARVGPLILRRGLHHARVGPLILRRGLHHARVGPRVLQWGLHHARISWRRRGLFLFPRFLRRGGVGHFLSVLPPPPPPPLPPPLPS